MSLYSFHIPDLLAQHAQSGKPITLPEAEAHHARTVLRLAGGELVRFFDGSGHSTPGTLNPITKKGPLTARVTGSLTYQPPPSVKLTLATAIPKATRADWLIEQCSQLGAWGIRWLKSDRGVVQLRKSHDEAPAGKIEKFRRAAIESAKQCGRPWLMGVEDGGSVTEILSAFSKAIAAQEVSDLPQKKILWLDPDAGAPAISEWVSKWLSSRAGRALDITALIGPEGGWSVRESELLSAAAASGRVEKFRLNANILRIETAAAAVTAIFMSS